MKRKIPMGMTKVFSLAKLKASDEITLENERVGSKNEDGKQTETIQLCSFIIVLLPDDSSILAPLKYPYHSFGILG